MKNKVSKDGSLVIRKFLNKQSGSAIVYVDCDKKGSGTVQITDCSRSITLDFYSYGEYDGYNPTFSRQHYKNNIAKLDILIDSLSDLREFITEAHNNDK